jgi:hypothetical protein
VLCAVSPAPRPASRTTGVAQPRDCARLCGEALARGHARTSDAATLAGYVGGSVKLDRAIAAFVVVYAEPSTRDYRRFVTSLRKAGRSLDQV